MKQHRLTDADHKKFDHYMMKWKELLNLRNWRIERIPGSSKAMAEIAIMREDRLAGYRTGKSFGTTTPVTDFSLEQTAVHELLHVFLDDYKDAVKSGSEDYIMSVEHSLITVLEGLLLKDNSCSQSQESQLSISSSLEQPSLQSPLGSTSGATDAQSKS